MFFFGRRIYSKKNGIASIFILLLIFSERVKFMKAKIYSKMFAVLLAASVIASGMPAASLTAGAESLSYASQGTGYETSGSSIPSFAMDAFNDAVTSYQDGTLTPLACYGEQVVAGYNYRFICRMNSDSQYDLNSLKFVTVYQNPQSVSTISEVSDFNIADYEETYDMILPDYPPSGSMEVISGLQACELPDDAQTVFNKVYDGLLGVHTDPIAFLGKRTHRLCWTWGPWPRIRRPWPE